mgnify:CR=1 FL=1
MDIVDTLTQIHFPNTTYRALGRVLKFYMIGNLDFYLFDFLPNFE